MKILICEDEFVSRRKLEKIIDSLGYSYLVAEDGQQAYELWENERPEMIISDWVMPHLTGIELCQRVRESEGSQYTYIIMVSAKYETEDMVAAIDAGADDFITKPYIIEELAVRIRAGERSRTFQTKDIVIFSLAKLSESRDTETGNHLERIRYFSRLLAENLANLLGNPLRINKLFIENIFLTSPLHDIGKVGIPDSILLKPGRLTEEERTGMQEHCRIGYNTLHEALEKYPHTDYLQMGSEIALYHHEKYDGSGYPEGFHRDQIPLAARIVALADVYDALTSTRTYKNAYSHEQTLSMIEQDSGSHFDPIVVQAFLDIHETFADIRQRFH